MDHLSPLETAHITLLNLKSEIMVPTLASSVSTGHE